MALGPDDLVLCAGTLAAASFRERIRAASAAAYRGVSLFPSDVRRARAEGLDDATMRGLLADHGLEVAEIDPLMTWLPGAAPTGPVFTTNEAECYQIAEAIGGRGINAVVFLVEPVPREVVVESFAALCERAADHGLLVHLEFMPWTQVASALDAMAIVEEAGSANGGIMLDTWHHFRSGVSTRKLLAEVPAGKILACQLNDAPAEAETDLVEETLHRRRLPGEGDIDLPEILRYLQDGGSPAPLGIEVFSDDLQDQAPEAVATRCAEAVRQVIRQR